jgi:hypothetical protein
MDFSDIPWNNFPAVNASRFKGLLASLRSIAAAPISFGLATIESTPIAPGTCGSPPPGNSINPHQTGGKPIRLPPIPACPSPNPPRPVPGQFRLAQRFRDRQK